MANININVNIKPITKLIEVISKGCGNLYTDLIRQPLQISRAKNNPELLIEYQADNHLISNEQLNSNPPISIEQASQSIAQYREDIARKNHTDAINIAYNELKNIPEEEISDDSVDEDWIHRWFNSVEFISSDDLKIIWGKLLAGEIKQPGSYSLRTLEFLKNISIQEAKLVQRIYPFVLVPAPTATTLYLYTSGIEGVYTFSEAQKTIELGLVQSTELSISTYNLSGKTSIGISNPNFLLGSTKHETSASFAFIGNQLTQIGYEIYNILNLPTLSEADTLSFFKSYKKILQNNFLTNKNKYLLLDKDHLGNFKPM